MLNGLIRTMRLDLDRLERAIAPEIVTVDLPDYLVQ